MLKCHLFPRPPEKDAVMHVIMGVLFSIVLPVRKPCDYGSTVFHNTPCSQIECNPSPQAIFGGPPYILEAPWHGVS